MIMIPNVLIILDLWLGNNRFKQYKAWKKDVSKELMSVA